MIGYECYCDRDSRSYEFGMTMQRDGIPARRYKEKRKWKIMTQDRWTRILSLKKNWN